jgi:hypothetical protein
LTAKLAEARQFFDARFSATGEGGHMFPFQVNRIASCGTVRVGRAIGPPIIVGG